MNIVKNLNETICDASFDVLKFERAYHKKHSEFPDFGTCGMAVVLISFGRKRKLLEEAKEAGLIDGDRIWYSAPVKSYVVNLPESNARTQNIDYFTTRANMYAEELKSYYEGTGVGVYVHSWID